MAALRGALDAQRKAKKRARKNGKKLQEAQHEVGRLKDAVNTRMQQFVRAIRERDHKHDQMMQLACEKEALQAQIVQLTQERDDAREVAEIRHQGWIMANHNAFSQGECTPRAARGASG